MHPDQITQFREQLKALKSELIGAMANAANDIRPVALDQAAVGRVSRGDAMQMQQMALESSRRRERRLMSVDQGLKRLENQTYGVCVDCDEEININRLEIDPTAIRCIKCAERLSS